MKLKILVDMMMVRSEKPEMELQFIKRAIPWWEKDDIVDTILWGERKGLFIVRRSHACMYVRSSEEGQLFFSILRELVLMMAGEVDE